MNVLNYFKKENERLRTKHEGETFIFGSGFNGAQVATRSTYEILAEIDAMQGLNTLERLHAGRRNGITA